jgi:hypothetical protein
VRLISNPNWKIGKLKKAIGQIVCLKELKGLIKATGAAGVKHLTEALCLVKQVFCTNKYRHQANKFSHGHKTFQVLKSISRIWASYICVWWLVPIYTYAAATSKKGCLILKWSKSIKKLS